MDMDVSRLQSALSDIDLGFGASFYIMDDSGACIYRVDTDGSGKTADSMASLLPSMNQETGSLLETEPMWCINVWNLMAGPWPYRQHRTGSWIWRKYHPVYSSVFRRGFLAFYACTPIFRSGFTDHRSLWRAGWLRSEGQPGIPVPFPTTLFLCISPGMLYNGKTINKQ